MAELVRSVHVPRARKAPLAPYASIVAKLGTSEAPVPTPVTSFLYGQAPVPGQSYPVLLADARWSAFTRRDATRYFPEADMPVEAPMAPRLPVTRGAFARLVMDTDF